MSKGGGGGGMEELHGDPAVRSPCMDLNQKSVLRQGEPKIAPRRGSVINKGSHGHPWGREACLDRSG